MKISTQHRAGFSVLELLIVLAVLSIIFGIGAVSLGDFNDPLRNASSQLEGVIKQTRARAMSTTSAYRLVRTSDTTLIAQRADRCTAANGDWAADSSFELDLREWRDVSIERIDPLAANDVVTCFNSRGLTNSNVTITLQDGGGRSVELEILLGGAVEVRR